MAGLRTGTPSRGNVHTVSKVHQPRPERSFCRPGGHVPARLQSGSSPSVLVFSDLNTVLGEWPGFVLPSVSPLGFGCFLIIKPGFCILVRMAQKCPCVLTASSRAASDAGAAQVWCGLARHSASVAPVRLLHRWVITCSFVLSGWLAGREFTFLFLITPFAHWCAHPAVITVVWQRGQILFLSCGPSTLIG